MRLKQGQILPTFTHTITILNKLRAVNSPTKLDAWYKTVLHNTAYTSQGVRSVSGTTVNIGQAVLSRIPKSSNYKPYEQWLVDPSQGFTISVGDIIIKGEITETQLAPENIYKILQKYKPGAFTISVFSDNTGVSGLAEHYRVEGV